jgi:excisionase family DNA binding protein
MAELMTVEEIAVYLRLTKRTIYRLLKKGTIPAVKVGNKWRFDRNVIDKWLQPKMGEDRVRILVIDDDAVIGLLFKEALDPLGHTVIATGTSKEGIEYAERLTFDMVFLDLKMPDIDGAETLARIKKVKPNLPVIIITGYPDSELMGRALEQGHFSVMKKPFGEAEILKAVEMTRKTGKQR